MTKGSYILFFTLICLICSCKNEKKSTSEIEQPVADVAYISFGKEIISDDAVKAKSMVAHYEVMQVGDSINSKMISKVKDVCQAKGCWMTLDMGNGEEVMVKFKDYGFFVPKDISGKDVIINGKAYIAEMSVDEQRHYAEDDGKTKEDIEKITEPKKTYLFEADGVLVAQ